MPQTCGRCGEEHGGSNMTWVTNAPSEMGDSFCSRCVTDVRNGKPWILPGKSIARKGGLLTKTRLAEIEEEKRKEKQKEEASEAQIRRETNRQLREVEAKERKERAKKREEDARRREAEAEKQRVETEKQRQEAWASMTPEDEKQKRKELWELSMTMYKWRAILALVLLICLSVEWIGLLGLVLGLGFSEAIIQWAGWLGRGEVKKDAIDRKIASKEVGGRE